MKPSKGSLIFFAIIAGLILLLFIVAENPVPLLPPLIALALLALTSSAGWSLFAGSLVGVLLIGDGSVLLAPWRWLTDHLWPSLASTWHWSALIFTLLLAAFAAIVEKSGALAGLLAKWSRTADAGARSSRLQLSIVGLGLICFFDGLANALMLGRVGRSLADQAGVSREKLAYLVDTTSSAVACVAFLSTWSVFQLTLIAGELEGSAFTEPAYLLFLKSIPTNFYCLGSLVLVFLAARWNWNPPPMSETTARSPKPLPTDPSASFSLPSAIGPLATLVLSVPLAFWVLGGKKPFPTSAADIQAAFGTSLGPYALLLAGALAIAGAILFFPGKKSAAIQAIPSGLTSILPALIVLLMAWTLGSTLGQLETGKYLAGLLGDRFQITYLPGATFVLGCLIAFCTGTSWGTMALLMPLALGTFLSMIGERGLDAAEVAPLLPAIIGAVFGGAVFGDHASPFSDTTIVSAMACDVTTTRHVATQLPYAILASGCAVLFGYLPIGMGLTPAFAGPIPLIAIIAAVLLTRRRLARNQ
ncbi:Na+/H+ antiporter NhaC family protein [Roseibacillus persicicus]|uniref:Na+/H+ antiporter NhaC-like C-terminal domain-containing protein n=1 Tax=Roseibacillus persicicus TaxID=454148 RepID=A0A918TJQ7_9BACT|nr:Na+/H+ antiporter NhaC family protein [Roseibacillus persicicus]GHC50149.1 hypothetical protein GCM10007100_15280 [Roseibacillus persicicus]